MDYEYEVAFSFAGEQRDYVHTLSKELTRLKIEHFYDYNEQTELWGKNLTQYLDEVYFQKSRYFIPFISKEYKDKMWTKWELNSALERNLHQHEIDYQQYILPVCFDDTRIPGIIGSIAYIDAKKVDPHELAEIIFEKVRKEKVSPMKFNNDQYTYTLPHSYVEIHGNEISRLKSMLDLAETSKAIIISGEKGIGKKTAINISLIARSNVIKILPCHKSQYFCEPLLKAIHMKDDSYHSKEDFAFPDYIKKLILRICSTTNSILYFEGMNFYESAFLDFILEIVRTVLLNHSNYHTIVIMEYDDYEDSSINNQIYSISPSMIDIIRFHRVGNNELQNYFKKALGDIKICESDLTYIIESALGNIMYLNIIINYLRAKNIITLQDMGYICDKIKSGMLMDVMKEYILSRYDKLDSDLKTTLSKSTIIGNTFKAESLIKPFGIINANELLNRIEEISKLIVREESDSFSFETTDSYLLISQTVPSKEQNEWHRVLANYYSHMLKNQQSDKRKFTILQEITCLFQICYHFKYASLPKESIEYGYQLIDDYIKICDYGNAKKMIEEIRSLSDLVDIKTLEIKHLYFNLDWMESSCLTSTGEYFQALPLYQDCLKTIPTDMQESQRLLLKLETSYCYFMCGDSDKALELGLEIKSFFEQTRVDSLLYCKTLSFLASIYDYLGNTEATKSSFINALNICKEQDYEDEYYSILKKASMVYSEELSITMYTSCIEYFKSHHKTKLLAETLHNLATDELYLDNKGQINEPLQESIKIMDSFGSIMVYYPLNTQGIYEAIYNKNFENAIQIFTVLLGYPIESYSKVVIRTNLLNCYLKLERFEEAEKELSEIDQLVQLPQNNNVSEYKGFRFLNWAFYYFHTGLYDKCLDMLNHFSKIRPMESRFHYLQKKMQYETRKKLHLRARTPIGLPPKPILEQYLKHDIYFLTLRFYE